MRRRRCANIRPSIAMKFSHRTWKLFCAPSSFCCCSWLDHTLGAQTSHTTSLVKAAVAAEEEGGIHSILEHSSYSLCFDDALRFHTVREMMFAVCCCCRYCGAECCWREGAPLRFWRCFVCRWRTTKCPWLTCISRSCLVQTQKNYSITGKDDDDDNQRRVNGQRRCAVACCRPDKRFLCASTMRCCRSAVVVLCKQQQHHLYLLPCALNYSAHIERGVMLRSTQRIRKHTRMNERNQSNYLSRCCCCSVWFFFVCEKLYTV